MTLALGRRALAAHPPYGSTGGLAVITCAQAHVRRHVHDASGHVLYPMPDGCAACGRTWFTEDEVTYMGYCGDCWPGYAILLDYGDGAGTVAATGPQPVRHRAPVDAGAFCEPCRAMRAAYGQMTAACPAHRKPSYPDVAAYVRNACVWCGTLGTHALDCPYGPVMQYVNKTRERT